MPPIVSPQNDYWGMSVEIPWHFDHFNVGSASDWLKICLIQSEALPRAGKWYVISMEFTWLFLRLDNRGKPVMASQNVGCFLRLFVKKKKWVPTLHLDGNEAKNPEAIVLQVVSKHYNVDLQWSAFSTTSLSTFFKFTLRSLWKM